MNLPFSFWQNPNSLRLLSGIVAYYKLDNAGNTFIDSIGGNNLTNVQTPVLNTGIIRRQIPGTSLIVSDSAFYCTGFNGLISITNRNPIFDITGDKTFAVWNKSLPIRGSDYQPPIFFNGPYGNISAGGSYAGSGGYFFQLINVSFNNIHNKVQFQLFLRDSPGSVVATAIATTGQWHLNIIKIDFKSRTVTLNVDTVDFSPSTWNSTNVLLNSTGAFSVGSSPYINGLAAHLLGSGNELIDELGIWNKVLTQTEINILYNNGRGNQYPFNF